MAVRGGPVRRNVAWFVVICVFAFATSSCDTRPPTGTDMKRVFGSTKASYVELRSMIMQDLSRRQYETVGIDLINGYGEAAMASGRCRDRPTCWWTICLALSRKCLLEAT